MIFKAIVYKVNIFYSDSVEEFDCDSELQARTIAGQHKQNIVVISKVLRSYDTANIINSFSEKQLEIISDTRWDNEKD